MKANEQAQSMNSGLLPPEDSVLGGDETDNQYRIEGEEQKEIIAFKLSLNQ